MVATENGYNLYVCGNGGAVARWVAPRNPTLVLARGDSLLVAIPYSWRVPYRYRRR